MNGKDRNFFRKMAIRENPIRSVMCLPLGLDLDEIAWRATREEILIERLRMLKATWDREDLERYRRYAAELALVVEKDREYIERANAIECEEAWHRQQLADGASVMQKFLARYQDELDGLRQSELRARLVRAGKEIERDRCRVEKEELTRRGVYRGR